MKQEAQMAAGAVALVILGAGGHGREVLDVVRAVNAAGHKPEWRFLGFVDDGVPDEATLARICAGHLGGQDELAALRGVHYVVGVASGPLRERLATRAEAAGLVPAVLVHPRATLGADVRLSAGVVVFAHADVTTNVDLGRHVHIGQNALVAHDCVVEPYATVLPSAVVAGGVRLGRRSCIGLGATVADGVRIGQEVVVAPGAVVCRDLLGPGEPVGRQAVATYLPAPRVVLSRP